MQDISLKEKITKRVRVILAVFFVAGLFVFLVFFGNSDWAKGSLVEYVDNFLKRGTVKYYEYPQEIEFVLERKLDLKVTKGQIAEYAIQATRPENIPNLQEIIKTEASQDPNETNQSQDFVFIKWQGSDLKKENSIILTYHIKTKSYDWNINPQDSGTVESVPEEIKSQYLKDEWSDGNNFRIAPSNETIKNLAFDLTKDKTNVYDKTKAIYDFMINNITYLNMSTNDLPKLAFQTLEKKQGDCDDQAILFVSLARAAGIPARLMAGLVYDPAKTKWEEHVWTQVFIPQINNFADVDVVAKNLFFRDAFRFVDFVDSGSDENLNFYYTPFSGQYFKSETQTEFTQSYTTLNFDQKGTIRKISLD